MANYIKNIRVQKQLSQYTVADKLGISQNSYWLLENGHTKITMEHIAGFSVVFNVDCKQLLTDFFEQI
ncbi:helix-turn-helix domain-containing protein [Pedobacter psychrodurus]|nr:helix-turn-helix transcriptional regulator [Pedobacter psychrodurus]